MNLDDQGSVLAAVGKVKAALVALGETDIEVDLNEDSLNAAADLFEERLDEIGSIELRVDKSSQSSVRSAIAALDRELERLAEVEIKVKLDRASLEAERKKLEKALRLELKVDPRSSNSVKAAIAQIDAELAKSKEIDLSVKMDEKSLKKARERLEKHLTLDLSVDKKSMSSVEGALKQIEDQLDELNREEIKVKVDKRSLLTAQAQMKAVLDAEVRAKVTADRASAQKTADQIQAQLDAIKVRPGLDAKRVAQVKRELEASFEQMRNLRAQITPEMDALAKRHVERQIDDLKDKVDKLKSEIEPEVSRTGIAATIAHLALLTRNRIVDLIPRVNLSAAATATAMLKALSGARVLGNLFDSLWNSIKNLDKSAPLIGTLATAIAGLGATGIAAAGNLASLSASLASIAPTALLLPGLFGGIAVGLGVSVAALKDFNKRVPEVKQALKGLQDTISNNFWDKAEKPIRAVVDDLLPKFTSGVKKTATELGGFFGSFATNLGTSLGPALDQMFTDLSDSIGIATKGTDTFASIIATLGKVGTSYLPDLANWFVSISEKFDHFLQKKGENGLKLMIDEGIQALKDLGSVLYNAGGILAGFARAAEAGGGSTLGSLADALEHIHKVVDSPGFQDGMTKVFLAAHEAMSRIAKESGPAVEGLFKTLGGLLTTILPQVGTIIGTALGAIASALSQPAVTQGVTTLFNGIEGAVTKLAPALGPVGKALGAIFQVVGQALPIFAELVSTAITPLANAFAQLAPQLSPIITLLGGALTQAFAALAPVIEQMVPMVGELLGQAFGFLATILPPVAAIFQQILEAAMPLAKAFMDALAPILPVLAAALDQVIKALQPLIETALKIISAVIEPLLPMLSEVIQAVLPPLSDAITRVVEALQPFLDALLAVVNFLMPILVPVIQFIVELLAGALVAAINGVGLVLEGLKEYFVGLWEYVSGWFQLFVDLFTGNWDQLGADAKRIWDGIVDMLHGIWDLILGALEVFFNIGILGTAGKALKGLGALFKAGWKAITELFTGAFAAIRGYIGLFFTGARGLALDGMKAIGKFFSDGWASITGGVRLFFTGAKQLVLDGLKSMGKFFVDSWNSIRTTAVEKFTALVSTVGEWIGKAVSKVKELPEKAKSALSSLGSTLKTAGIELIKGFISGISSMFGSVKGKLGELTSKLTDWKGPLPKDKVLLYNAGQEIIKGLIRGLESQYDKVKQTLNDLTSKIPKTASATLRKQVNEYRTQLLKLTAQWDGLSKKLDAAKDKLKQLQDQKNDYAKQIADRIVDIGDPTKLEDQSFENIAANMKEAVEKAKRFAAALKKLKDLGLNQTQIDQIASAGPDAGLKAAESIAAAGKAGVDQLNELEKQLEGFGKSAGNTASSVLYDAGIKAAEGLVKGLEDKMDDLEDVMLKLADKMVKAIKKGLDIHSPSRLMEKLGAFTGLGLARGVEGQRGRVIQAMDYLTGAIAGSASSGVTAAVSGGLPSERGSSVTKVLNYYAGSGGSLSSEEELFAATSRARMVGW